MTTRTLKSATVGMVLATVLLTFLVVGSVMFAVSSSRHVHIPLLLTARSGKGADLLSLQVQAPGLLVWFVVLAALVTLPLVAVRRSDPRTPRS